MLNKIKSVLTNPACWSVVGVFVIAVLVTAMPELALAQGVAESDATTQGGDLARVFCNIINAFSGGIGRGIATIAVIMVGIGLFMGKLSWGLAIAVAVGIGALFGAESIVGIISGDDASTVCEGSGGADDTGDSS